MANDPKPEHRIRVKIFVDFWNFQISFNNQNAGFSVDWRKLGGVLAQEALKTVDASASLSYQGMNVYGSYGKSDKDKRMRMWAENTLDRFPGVQVTMLERQRKRKGPACPSCYEEIPSCPRCGSDMRGTEEKGVDTRIATDMIKLAWADNYDVAVLVSSDRDFVPVAEFLATRGIKTIHGAFPPLGIALSQACWGNIPIPQIMDKFSRT